MTGTGICFWLGDNTGLQTLHRNWFIGYANYYELPYDERQVNNGPGICIFLGDSQQEQAEHRERLEGYGDIWGLYHEDTQNCC